MKIYFYHKPNRDIEPSNNEILNRKAKQRLDEIHLNRNKLKIPKHFIENWNKVALYDPSGNPESAVSILIEPENGAYHLENKLNDLTGKEWIKFTCSWFVFNALKEDIKQEKAIDPATEDHPATYSPTMISDFIRFFTKEGDKVLDPFVGIGSTLEACKRTNRIGYGIELNPKYYNLCLKRTPEFKNNIFNDSCLNIDKIKINNIDFCISSPPYWDILNRSTHNYKNKRKNKELDVKYSDSELDLGNIEEYEVFLNKLKEVYLKIYNLLKNKAYVVIIIKNVKKGGRLYPIAWDIARMLSDKYVLKDEKIWIQDKVGLAPYGYPYSWASNILHHYCIVLRKEE